MMAAMSNPSRSAGGTLAAACFAIMLAQIANVTPAPINGEIQTSLHATGVGLAWVTSAFLLPTAILELSFGVLGDLLGRRRVLLAGTALLAAGSLVAGSAHSVHLLWAGQAIAGIGAGALIPTSLAIAVASARDDEIEDGVFHFLDGRIDLQRAIDMADAGGADRAHERHAGQR